MPLRSDPPLIPWYERFAVDRALVFGMATLFVVGLMFWLCFGMRPAHAQVAPGVARTISAVKTTCLRTATAITCPNRSVSMTVTATGATAVYLGGSNVATATDNCIGSSTSCTGTAWNFDVINRVVYCRVVGVGNSGENVKVRATCLGE